MLVITRKQHATNHCLQDTNTHWQTTNVSQSYFTQSQYGTNLDENWGHKIVCDSDDSLTDVTKHLNTVFIKNYSRDFIERNILTWDPTTAALNKSYTTTATIPYIQGTSETTAGNRSFRQRVVCQFAYILNSVGVTIIVWNSWFTYLICGVKLPSYA